MIETQLDGKLAAAERLIAQGYLRRTADDGVILTKRGRDALRTFTGGPLARDSFELDSAYYGSVHVNRQDEVRWALDFLNGLAIAQQQADASGLDLETVLAGDPMEEIEAVRKPRPKPGPTFFWQRHFHEIEEPSLERLYFGGWELLVCWRLDVLRAVAELPPSRWRVFALYAEGWDRDEIAGAMGVGTKNEDGAGWAQQTVQDAIKKVSRHVRQRTNTETRAAGFREERPTPTQVANRVLAVIAWARHLTREREDEREARQLAAKYRRRTA